MDELNNKTIGYEEIDSPNRLPSVGKDSRTPSLQPKPLDSSVFQFSRWVKNSLSLIVNFRLCFPVKCGMVIVFYVFHKA